MIGVGLSVPQVAVRRKPSSGSSGPTVLLDANWATDTIVDDGLVPIADGNPVDVWTMATGGEWTYTTAAVAGASARPIWVAASGVHTAGASAALTTASPVTIPADTDCVIYVVANVAEYGLALALGSTAATGPNLRITGGSTGDTESSQISFGLKPSAFESVIATLSGLYQGQMTVRVRRVSNIWRYAATGVADAAMTVDGVPLTSYSISLDTLLATNGGASLNEFSASGCYIQKLKIWSGTSDPDTAYETANGGTL
jgi:hypothetical protein